MRSHPRILALLFDQPWAIAPRSLETMIARVESMTPVDLEALATRLGRPLENTGNRVEQRGSTAILDVTGPIFRHANLLVEVSGATSVEYLARDFETSLNNQAIENIVLRIDSPGGEVNGIADFAEQVRAGNQRKPVTAYIDGLGASAAYWIASAAGKVYGSVDSFSGSIGIVATLTDRRPAQERQGVKTYQIVSSQSPRKLIDPATDDGRAAILEMVDSLGELFVGAVARYRGQTSDHVMAEFGRGFVLPAQRALQAGMIDGVASEESMLAALRTRTAVVAGIAAQEEIMETTAGTPPVKQDPNPPKPQPTPPPQPDPNPPFDPDRPERERRGATAERERIQGILSLPEAAGRSALAQALAFEPEIDVAAARRILAAASAEPAASVNALDREMARVTNPKVGAAADDPNSVAEEAKRILAFLPAHQRGKMAS